jgi:hypothetical protein
MGDLTAAEAKALLDERGPDGWTVEQGMALIARLRPWVRLRVRAALDLDHLGEETDDAAS